RASRHSPPSAAWSTSSVPSPPSATGSSSASAHVRRPSARAPAASRAERTPLRLAGHASARASGIGGLLRRPRTFRNLRLRRVRHHAQHRERQSLAREKDQTHPDADRRLDRLQTEAESDTGRARNVVVLPERKRDRSLDEPDVPRPEREDRRNVHQDEHEAGGRQRLVDSERPHRRPDREELARPAEQLEEASERSRPRLPHDAETVACEPDDFSQRAEAAEVGDMMLSRAEYCDRKQRDARNDDGDQARDRPVGNVRGRNDEDDQRDRGDEIEHAVGEHRPEQRRPGTPLLGPPPARRSPRAAARRRPTNTARSQAGELPPRVAAAAPRPRAERRPRPRAQTRPPPETRPRPRAP